MAATLLNPTTDAAQRFALPACPGAKAGIGVHETGNALARRCMR